MRKIIVGSIVAILTVMMVLMPGASIVTASTSDAPAQVGPSFDWPPEMGFSPDNEMSQSQMQERIQELSAVALRHGMFGPFNDTDGAVDGYFVQFSYDKESGVITNYAVRTGETYLNLFQSVVVDQFAPKNMKVTGSVFKQWNDTLGMIAHNNPTAMLHIGSNVSYIVSFLLDENIAVSEMEVEGELDAVISVTNDQISGLIGVSNGTVATEERPEGTYVNVTVNEGQVFFRMRPYFAGVGAHFENQVMTAIANGKITNEMAIIVHNGDAISVCSDYDHRYTMKLHGVDGNRIMIQVSSEMTEGKVMMLRFDPQTIDASKGVKVTIDGQAVAEGDLESVLGASGAEMSSAKYLMVDEGDYYSLLVYIPHFSTHLLEVEGTAASDIPLSLIGIGAIAIAVIAIAAIGISRR